MKSSVTQKKSAAVVASKISPEKKKWFILITIAIIFLILLAAEAALRVFQYGGNVDLFAEGPPGNEKFLMLNPNVARRYFTAQTIIPTPPKQLFLKVKPQNCYRIFVLGESSAAGFPYETNASFPNILERALTNTFPEKKIEVINVGMSAVNSYTLLDLTDDILRQSPDALLIYAGHNEYYGALGVGSVQSFGPSRWLIRTYLKLRSIKILLVLRDFLSWTKTKVNNLLFHGSESDPSATLMERIVAEQTIPMKSPLYEAGKKQFEENMDALLQKAAENKVPVILSELVSNLRDQAPFISVDDENGHSAKVYYENAQEEERQEHFDQARQYYINAKDYDALRFRAPEEFNDILRNLAKKYEVPLAHTVSIFEQASVHQLIGNSLMLEHLHPNKEGYFLLAKSFYETMRNHEFIQSQWKIDGITAEHGNGITELDSVYADIVVRHLKAGWPFLPSSVPNRFIQDYRPRTKVEEIAFRVMQSTQYSLQAGHMELAEYHERQGELKKALDEYNALIVSIPQEMEFYQKAATILLEQKEFDRAEQILRQSLRYRQTLFSMKWLGQIALKNNNLNDAIQYLEKSDKADNQVIFNLGRAYYLSGQLENGDRCLERLRNISPASSYTRYLFEMRSNIRNKAFGEIENEK
ncbi:MAG: hypothetical protein JXA06_04830 [Bacteroidetes bacterium]|nr:hypothetical protein [Bacteroidota bacterium]